MARATASRPLVENEQRNSRMGPLPVKAIRFSCSDILEMSPEEVGGQILDLQNWPDFKGFGFLPGIDVAQFEIRTPQIVGSRIKVVNTDGSSHVEEIVAWQPGRGMTLHMKEFSAPLARLATGFEERWDFERTDRGTKVVRSFTLHPTSAFTRPVLWLISVFLKKAIARHLAQMRAGVSST
jgi:hypothetical protein